MRSLLRLTALVASLIVTAWTFTGCSPAETGGGKMQGPAPSGTMDGGAMDKGKMGGAMDKGKMDGGAMDKGKMEVPWIKQDGRWCHGQG